MIPYFTIDGVQNCGVYGKDDVIRLTNKAMRKSKTYGVGSTPWRILHFAHPKENDVHQWILGKVWCEFLSTPPIVPPRDEMENQS